MLNGITTPNIFSLVPPFIHGLSSYSTTFVPQFLFLHLMIACSSFPDMFPLSVSLLNPDCIFRYSPVSVTDQKYRYISYEMSMRLYMEEAEDPSTVTNTRAKILIKTM